MTTTTRATASTGTTVDRFLEAIASGRGGTVAHLYAEDAVLDATVPNWRFHRQGGRAIAGEYARWFASPGRFEELDRQPVAGGEVVTYVLSWQEDGVPHAAHHCHRLLMDETGSIVADRVFCGGRWNAALLADMAEADNAD